MIKPLTLDSTAYYLDKDQTLTFAPWSPGSPGAPCAPLAGTPDPSGRTPRPDAEISRELRAGPAYPRCRSRREAAGRGGRWWRAARHGNYARPRCCGLAPRHTTSCKRTGVRNSRCSLVAAEVRGAPGAPTNPGCCLKSGVGSPCRVDPNRTFANGLVEANSPWAECPASAPYPRSSTSLCPSRRPEPWARAREQQAEPGPRPAVSTRSHNGLFGIVLVNGWSLMAVYEMAVEWPGTYGVAARVMAVLWLGDGGVTAG